MKKLLSLLLVLCMVLGMSVNVWATETSGTCGENVTWFYDTDTKTLTISGSGAMADYFDPTTRPWNSYIGEITSVVIEHGVTDIGRYAFQNCSALARVTIPDTVTTIDLYAFVFCKNLTHVTIPSSVTEIGSGAFANCTQLETVEYLGISEPRVNEAPDQTGTVFAGCSDNLPVHVSLYYSSNNFCGKSVANDLVVYSVFIACNQGGTVTASPEWAKAGTSVRLYVEADVGYELDTLIVNDVTVTDNKFTMPDSDVTGRAIFKAVTTGGDSGTAQQPDDSEDYDYEEEIEDDTESLVVRIKFDGVDEENFDEIKVNLLRNGKKYDSEELSASRNSKKDWRYEWEGLDEDENWSVALAAELEDYETEIVNLRGNYWTITLSAKAVSEKVNPNTGAGVSFFACR